jgi:hypothetical protein
VEDLTGILPTNSFSFLYSSLIVETTRYPPVQKSLVSLVVSSSLAIPSSLAISSSSAVSSS